MSEATSAFVLGCLFTAIMALLIIYLPELAIVLGVLLVIALIIWCLSNLV